MDGSLKKLLLLLLLIPNLVMAELTPKSKGKPIPPIVKLDSQGRTVLDKEYDQINRIVLELPNIPLSFTTRTLNGTEYDQIILGDKDCTSDTILTSSKKIHGITFLIKTIETSLAKDHEFCYRYDYQSPKDMSKHQLLTKTEFVILDLDNRVLEHKHVDDSDIVQPIKLTEGSRDFPYTIISTQTHGVSDVFNTHHIYRTSPSFKKIAVLHAGEPDINIYKSNGVYLFEVYELYATGGPRSDWTFVVETFALINDELISIDKRFIDQREERYDICANEDFMTLDCYLSDKYKRSKIIIPPPGPK